MQTRRDVLCGSMAAVLFPRGCRADDCATDHVQWVSRVFQQMRSIQPGMSRQQLLVVFTTEGGLSTGLQRTYVCRECPYFKVNVRFHAVGRPERDAEGRVTLQEDGRDVIASISEPFLQGFVAD